MKKLIIFFCAFVIFLSACNTKETEPGQSGTILPLDELSYDWGDISIEGGEVEKGFHFKNDSKEDLILTGVRTSCMCTIAYFELPNGSVSPEFGMHGAQDWEYTIEPGEEFELEIIFDPMAHGPDGVGEIQRLVSIFSSASESQDIQLFANVLYDDEYQELYGDADFVFEESEYDFGLVKQSGGIVSHEFEFAYMGDEEITVTSTPTSCACTSAEISQNTFKKGEKGTITVFFDPNLHEEPAGVFFKTVSLLTSPELEKQPEVKIWAEIDLDLGPEAYKLSEDHED